MAETPGILHSIYGRFAGVTKAGELTGKVGINQGVQALTSASTGTQISAYGITTINAITTLSTPTYILAPPVAGAYKVIASVSTSTAVKTISLSTSLGGNFQSTLGSSFQTVVFNSGGIAISLFGVSTSIWQVLTNTSSAAMTT